MHLTRLSVALAVVVTSATAYAQEGAAPASGESASPAPQAAPAATAPRPAARQASAKELLTVEEGYNVRLKDLEEKVNDLKEKVFRSKARLSQLASTVIVGSITGPKVQIMVNNEMGGSFILQQLKVTMDGTPILTKTIEDDPSLPEKNELEVLNERVAPGNHTLEVVAIYQGNGRGLFSYMDGYRFTVPGKYVFSAQEGQQTVVKAVAYEKGGITTPLTERPTIRFEVNRKAVSRTKEVSSKAPEGDKK
ncbi:MAG: hypothetical protein GMKNLPBB_01679 [Myxococcota bacterium]|nr:hypothetical protein [Myxococcota bacterium]